MAETKPISSDQRDTAAGSALISAADVNILLVDDSESTLHVTALLLRRSKYRVTTATCIREALLAAETQKFDVVVSDIGLPDGTGMDLMNELRTRGPIRGIAVTGLDPDEDVNGVRATCFNAHLTKPIEYEQLDSAIRHAVAR